MKKTITFEQLKRLVNESQYHGHINMVESKSKKRMKESAMDNGEYDEMSDDVADEAGVVAAECCYHCSHYLNKGMIEPTFEGNCSKLKCRTYVTDVCNNYHGDNEEGPVGESGKDEVGEPNVPDIDYDHPNSEDCTKLAEFLRKSGLMPRTKVQHAGANDWGKWDVMVGPISDYEDGYILFYWWADTFDEHADRYLFFLKDGVENDYDYLFEKNPDIIAELDKIVDVFGKSKKWKDE